MIILIVFGGKIEWILIILGMEINSFEKRLSQQKRK